LKPEIRYKNMYNFTSSLSELYNRRRKVPASFADRAHDRELQELQGHRTATHRRILSYFAWLVHAVNQSPSVPQDIHKISNRYPGLDVVDINSGYPLDIH